MSLNDVQQRPAMASDQLRKSTLSTTAIIAISICCIIAIVIIFIIIGYCYTRRPSTYEIHLSDSNQFSSTENPLPCPVPESMNRTSAQTA